MRRLVVLLAVVDEGGFTAAADALAMSQPAVSQAVRELETELGAALFHRLGRTVALTPAGEALVPAARQALRDLEVGRRAVDEVTGLAAGHLDLACLPTLAVAPLAPLVGAFRVAHPGVTVRLADPTNTAELHHLVRTGQCEVGLAEDSPAPGLETVPLWRQEFLVVLPPGSDVEGPVRLSDMARWPLVATPPGTSTRGLLDDAIRRSATAATVAVEAAQREALLPLILAGAGVSLLPEPMADLARALGCVVAEPRPAVSRAVALVHRPGPLSPAARAFIELALERRASTLAGGP